jgi:hypothetical protein
VNTIGCCGPSCAPACVGHEPGGGRSQPSRSAKQEPGHRWCGTSRNPSAPCPNFKPHSAVLTRGFRPLRGSGPEQCHLAAQAPLSISTTARCWGAARETRVLTHAQGDTEGHHRYYSSSLILIATTHRSYSSLLLIATTHRYYSSLLPIATTQRYN